MIAKPDWPDWRREIEDNTANATWWMMFRCSLLGEDAGAIHPDFPGNKMKYLKKWKGKVYRVPNEFWAGYQILIYGIIAAAIIEVIVLSLIE